METQSPHPDPGAPNEERAIEPVVDLRGAPEVHTMKRSVITAAFILCAAPVLAGPCTQRIAEVEKSLTARQEGSGPTLSAPATTGSTTAASTTNPTAQNRDATKGLEALQQAKQLDQQGKEA